MSAKSECATSQVATSSLTQPALKESFYLFSSKDKQIWRNKFRKYYAPYVCHDMKKPSSVERAFASLGMSDQGYVARNKGKRKI